MYLEEQCLDGLCENNRTVIHTKNPEKNCSQQLSYFQWTELTINVLNTTQYFLLYLYNLPIHHVCRKVENWLL